MSIYALTSSTENTFSPPYIYLDDLGLSITHVSRPMLKMGEIATEILIREISSDNSLKENIVKEISG